MSTPYKLFTTASGSDSAAPTTDGVAISGTSTYYSDMWGGLESTGYSLTVVYTGTPTGTFTLQVSDVPDPDESSDTVWVAC